MKNRILFMALCMAFVLACTGQSDPPQTFTDSRDGTVFELVSVGGLEWFASDLTYTNEDLGTLVDGHAYYNWQESKLACPSGTHLATQADWLKLKSHYGKSNATYRGFPHEKNGVYHPNVGVVATGNGYYHSGYDKFKRMKFEKYRSMVWYGYRMPISNGVSPKDWCMSIRCVVDEAPQSIEFRFRKETLYTHVGDSISLADFFGENFQYVTDVGELNYDTDVPNLEYQYSWATKRVRKKTLTHLKPGRIYSVWTVKTFTIHPVRRKSLR